MATREVQFHHGMGDKLAYACRLVRKAYRAGVPMVVTADALTLRQLDRQLWVFEDTEFIPHVLSTEGLAVESRLAATPVWLTDQPASAPGPRKVLINLGQSLPEGIEAFERFFDVVSIGPEDRQAGRQRWRHYESQGWTVTAHVAKE